MGSFMNRQILRQLINATSYALFHLSHDTKMYLISCPVLFIQNIRDS